MSLVRYKFYYMFSRFLICFVALMPTILFSQNLEKDVIHLQDVVVEKDVKKPKVKKVKCGNFKQVYVNSNLYFTEDPVFYLTDSLPEGTIQVIKLFFTEIAHVIEFGGRDYSTFKVNKTEFEVTLYEVNDDYSVGEKVNSEPMLIALEECTNDRLKKVELDLSKYNYKTNKFFISVKKLTDTSCRDCYYYAPVNYKAKDGYCRYLKAEENNIYKKKQDFSIGLQLEVKTLTSDY